MHGWKTSKMKANGPVKQDIAHNTLNAFVGTHIARLDDIIYKIGRIGK